MNQRGMSKPGLLVLATFIGAVVYFGSQVATFFYSFFEIEGLMEFQAQKAQVLSDKEIRQNILQRIKELRIPFDDPEDLKMNRVSGEMIIEFSYDEVLVLEFRGKTYDLHVFHFNPKAKAAY